MKYALLSLLLMLAVAHGAEPLPMVIIGDSTVCEYPEASPARGWGHYIQGYFKEDIRVVNLAASGRSTKTFIAEGRWKKALEEKPRYVLIQFGHNDSHPAARPEATNVDTEYPDFLRRYIEEARAIGAIPILVTPMVRRLFEGDKLRDELAPYATAMLKVAAERKAPVVDLHMASKELVEKMGETKSMEFANTPTDRTHFNAKGAQAMAELVMKELPKAEPSLKAYLK